MTEAAIRAMPGTAQPEPESWGLIAVRQALAAEGRSRRLPFMKTAGLSDTLELIRAEPGLLRLKWTAEAPLDSYDGIIQGGMLAVIADVAQGHTFSTLLDAPCGFSTVDLSTRYIRRSLPGRPMRSNAGSLRKRARQHSLKRTSEMRTASSPRTSSAAGASPTANSS